MEVVSLPKSTDGSGFTVTLTVSKLVQPLTSVPVNTYSVSADGEMVMLGVVSPVDQLYVEAPEAVNVAESPEQIVWSEPAETVGEFTVTVTLS